ncbi:hypothetical protein PTKU46_89970 [Paraburkholderia terrae]
MCLESRHTVGRVYIRQGICSPPDAEWPVPEKCLESRQICRIVVGARTRGFKASQCRLPFIYSLPRAPRFGIPAGGMCGHAE